jgi:Ca2+:H+ antiporter
MLVFVPLAAIAHALDWGGLVVFGCAALAIVPLAGAMGDSTERLAHRLGAGMGALLNATFGNAAELIIALAALQKGLDSVVKASITGSIIGNGLLVLGLSMLLGGFKRERQTFDRSASSAGATLFALAAIGLIVPAAFDWALHRPTGHAPVTEAQTLGLEHALSMAISVVLFVAYILSLFFALRTHRHLYAGSGHESETPADTGWRRPAMVLLAATAGVAWMSELLVGAVEEASHVLGFTEVFVGVIVVAIIGNAAEHSTAVMMAMKNKMDITVNIAVGSSLQIALFVAPLLVFVSNFIGPHPMDLLFTPFEVLAVLIAVWVVHMVAQDGESNWLEGALLLAVYLVLGLAFYFLP